MTVIFIALLLLSVAASSASAFLLSHTEQALPLALPGWVLVRTWAGWTVSFASLLLLLFVVIYWVMPNVKLSLAQVLPGGLLATAGFGLATQLVPVYLRYFDTSFQAHATFGLLLLVMFWLFILGNVSVLGAELNALLSHPHLHAPATRPGLLGLANPHTLREP